MRHGFSPLGPRDFVLVDYGLIVGDLTLKLRRYFLLCGLPMGSSSLEETARWGDRLLIIRRARSNTFGPWSQRVPETDDSRHCRGQRFYWLGLPDLGI